MAVDFQVVFPQQTIPLNGVDFVQGIDPPTLNLIGEDFSAVDQVFINDLPSPSVVVLSRTRLLAQVPDALVHSVVSSVAVVSRALTVSSKSLIQFQIGPVPSKVSGVLRLVQIFLKILLTTPGRDIFSPKIGGNALKNVGLTFGKDQGGAILSDFIIAVDTTRKQILAIQSRDPSIPRNERLLGATVKAADYNQSESALIVSVDLTSQAGQSATANLMV